MLNFISNQFTGNRPGPSVAYQPQRKYNTIFFNYKNILLNFFTIKSKKFCVVNYLGPPSEFTIGVSLLKRHIRFPVFTKLEPMFMFAALAEYPTDSRRVPDNLRFNLCSHRHYSLCNRRGFLYPFGSTNGVVYGRTLLYRLPTHKCTSIGESSNEHPQFP